jgi:hypothetical protein
MNGIVRDRLHGQGDLVQCILLARAALRGLVVRPSSMVLAVTKTYTSAGHDKLS